MEYKIIRSNRKTMQLSIDDDLCPVVRCSYLEPASNIDNFVKKYEKWIEKNTARKSERLERESVPEEEIEALKKKARLYLTERTAYYSRLMGLYPTGIKITSAKTRFGSCSGKNSICYSYKLMLYPNEAIDYVVVHELAHIKYKNHGTMFYRLIEKYMPDYRERIKLLK